MNWSDVIVTCISVAALLVSGIAVLISRATFSRNFTDPRWRMRDEYEMRNDERKLFWAINGLFEEFKANTKDLPITTTFRNLVLRSGMPPGLGKVADLLDYNETYLRNTEQEVLYCFCHWIYPFRGYEEHFVVSRTFDEKQHQTFLTARSNQGGFWDLWVKRIGAKKVEREFPKEGHLVIALSWLDIAHRKHRGECSGNKEFLYRLGHRFQKKLSQQDRSSVRAGARR